MHRHRPQVTPQGRTEGYGIEWSAGLQRGTDAELDAWLAFALDMCTAADAISLAAFRSEIEVTRKADGSFVTPAERHRAPHPRAHRLRLLEK